VKTVVDVLEERGINQASKPILRLYFGSILALFWLYSGSLKTLLRLS
jgi:hypothetical protein